MAISTLSKFTVPLANDQSSASQGLLMPKLQYRFRVILENFGVSTPRSELTKQVIDVTRPNLTFDDVTSLNLPTTFLLDTSYNGCSSGYSEKS